MKFMNHAQDIKTKLSDQSNGVEIIKHRIIKYENHFC